MRNSIYQYRQKVWYETTTIGGYANYYVIEFCVHVDFLDALCVEWLDIKKDSRKIGNLPKTFKKLNE